MEEQYTEYTINRPEDTQPYYIISVAARMLGLHPRTLYYYERSGLVAPQRSRGNIRLYSMQDIRRIRQVQRLINDLGVNLAGVEVVLRMGERLLQMEQEMARMEQEVEHLRAELKQQGASDF